MDKLQKGCTMSREGALFRAHVATFSIVVYLIKLKLQYIFELQILKQMHFGFSQYDSITYSRVVCSK